MPTLWTLQKWNAEIDRMNKFNGKSWFARDVDSPAYADFFMVTARRFPLNTFNRDQVNGLTFSFADPGDIPDLFNYGSDNSVELIDPEELTGPRLFTKQDVVPVKENITTRYRTTAPGERLEYPAVSDLWTSGSLSQLHDSYLANHVCSFAIEGWANGPTLAIHTLVAQQAYENYFNTVRVKLACFAKTDPVVMKVSSALVARRPWNEYKTKKTSFAGADCAEAPGCGCDAQCR